MVSDDCLCPSKNWLWFKLRLSLSLFAPLDDSCGELSIRETRLQEIKISPEYEKVNQQQTQRHDNAAGVWASWISCSCDWTSSCCRNIQTELDSVKYNNIWTSEAAAASFLQNSRTAISLSTISSSTISTAELKLNIHAHTRTSSNRINKDLWWTP